MAGEELISMFSLKDKSIIVTGAAGGIGRASALLLAELGARVTAVDKLADQVAETAAEIARRGGWGRSIAADLTIESDIVDLVADTVAQAGRIDGCFNNAGVEQRPASIESLSMEEWRRVIDCNLTSVFLCMKHQVPAMRQTGGGVIINTSSTLGQVAIDNVGAYVASKHGVIGLTKAAAVESSRHGIRVNALVPGGVATPMHSRGENDPDGDVRYEALRLARPMERIASPEEMARTVAWLFSDATSYMTGASIAVDGGFLAK
jgi:NAD(P)-dependent dehydrogenase (short-subunit alcohol dehydrogenase family)